MYDLNALIAETIRHRFEAKFYVTPGCWIWTGAQHGEGYGHFRHEGKVAKAHMVSYRMYVGDSPKHLIVRHKCDNTSCVNPDHLVLGTHADNSKDRGERQRTAVGESHGKTKLTDNQVREAKDLLKQGYYRDDVAKAFGVSGRTIWYAIKTRQLD